MIDSLRKLIPDTHPLRLFYHKLLAFIAALIYWFPADGMVVIGVTGTNGKTTTSNLIANLLSEAGYKVGMITTINFQILDEKWVNDQKQTSFGPFKTQAFLRKLRKAGCRYAVLELSSHAATQSRVLGINIDVMVLTNVSRDHLEYHGGFNNYLNAKASFFQKVSRSRRKFGVPKVFVLNADDPYFEHFDQFVADRKINYGLNLATVYAAELNKEPEGTTFNLHVPNNVVPVRLALPGEFNVYNALAAASVALALQVPLEVIKAALDRATTISGRFEHVDKGQKYSIVVDYAHAPDSLENLLALYRRLTKGRLFVVFGATGGGRDKSKRPEMGKIAHEFADYIVVTDDDPYVEDEWEIIDQVATGITRQEGHNFWKIPDRREAIRLALTLAREGDTVVIAGKGCEEVMMVRGKTVKWNDKKVAEELLSREIKVEIYPEHFERRENVCLIS